MSTRQNELDAVTFEILSHKLESIVAEGYYTIGRVSGNAVVYEAGDHQEALMTADGDLAAFGAGVLHWTTSMSMAVKRLIELYGDEIHEGDQFLQNDPYTGCLHAMDMQILTPVFWEGILVAWTGSASHQDDTGAIDPGGFGIRATERYQEGFQTPGIKIVEKGKIKRDVEETFRNMIRTPDRCMLDISAKIAACNVMRERLYSTVERYGIDTVLTLFEQAIRTSEEGIRSKLREIPDGRWEAVNYVEGFSVSHYKIKLALIKGGDTLTFDFTGTSPQTPGSENVSAVGAVGSAVDPFIPMMCWDIPWNSGMFRPLKFVLPEGSVVNPTKGAAVSCNTPAGAAYITTATAQNALSKMLLSSDKFRREACGNSMTGSQFPVWSGLNKDGIYFASHIMDALAGGSGALEDRDGDNTSANMWCAKVMISNVETNEMNYPVFYLTRKEVPDSGGPGKFRGGLSLLCAYTPWDTEKLVNIHQGSGQEPRNSLGLAGGYPASSSRVYKIRNTEFLEKIKQGKPPRSLEEIGGTVESFEKGLSIFEVGKEEVIYYTSGGGGGYGDPLERSPELMLKDVIKGDVSLGRAKKDYGVVIDPEKLEIDLEETEKERRRMIEERLKIGRK